MGGVLRITSHLTIRCIQERIQKILVGGCYSELGLMLIMQKRLDPETSVNKPFENVLCEGANSQIFSERRHQFSSLF